MPQGYLPFKYEEEKNSTNMTALAGLPPYIEFSCATGMADSIVKNVKVRGGTQGWTDVQQILSLVLLNIAGGTCVDDVRNLRGDHGFVEIFQRIQFHNMRRREREAMEKRLRGKKSRGVPSPSAIFEYLDFFHDPEEEKKREAHKAFIPAPNKHLKGLRLVNKDIIASVQRRRPQSIATLDTDATLVETSKENSMFCYKGYKSYQPFNVYFPTMNFEEKGKFKIFGIVTNRAISAIAGDKLIWWYRERCGKSEEAHSVIKEDLAGGKLPSGLFGVNAAWWAIMILAFNLISAMKHLVIGGEWVNKRMKAIRFALINLPGRIIKRSRELIVRLTGGHVSNELLFMIRGRILAFSNAP